MATPTAEPARQRSGLLTFAGVMLLVAAVFNLIDGIVALVADDHHNADELLVGNLTAWGIWWLALGALLAFAGLQVLARKSAGAVLGFTLAGLNAFTQFAFIGAYPAWAIVAIAVDGLIIYAIATHTQDFED